MRPNAPFPTATTFALLIAGIVLSGCAVRYDVVDSSVVRGQQLTPCGIEGTPFASLDFGEWVETYHRRVSEVVDEYFTMNDEDFVLDCTLSDTGDGSPVAQAGSALQSLALELPPWADGTRIVTKLSTGDVLRHYLDAYLCSLHEMRYRIEVTSDGAYASDSSASQSSTSSLQYMDRGDLNNWVEADREVIDRELETAGPALERVLTLMSADHRTSALKAQLQCILRASTDLRNALALFSEATACVGRLWDTQGIFRDFPAATATE